MLAWLIIAAALLAVEAVAIVVLWQHTRLTRRAIEHLVDLNERVAELERTAMRKGWPYVEEVISVDERSFHQPQHGEEGRG